MGAIESSSAATRVTVRAGHDRESTAVLDAYLSARGLATARRFEPKDDDDLNDALCAGEFDRVVFANLDALFQTVWTGHGELDRWKSAGVRIELASPPDGEPNGWRATVDATYQSHARWRRNRRRGQIIAACILSVLAIAAIAVLFLVIPPAQ